MTESLQPLLDRIQKDGVDKAEAKAAEIVAAAEQKAADAVKSAETRAAELLAGAETQAAAVEARGRTALEQAARDVVLAVGDAITALVSNLLREQTGQALTGDALHELITLVVGAYCRDPEQASRIEVQVAEKHAEQAKAVVLAALAEHAKAGLAVAPTAELESGFRISIKDGDVYHDFSGPAIAAALARLVRPAVADIVRRAVSPESAEADDES